MSYGGASGGGSIATGSDVALSSPATGQALVYNASIQKWSNASIAGAGITPVSVQNSNYTATANQFVPADASTSAFTVTLPITPAGGTIVAVKKIDSSVNPVTITAGGADVFNKAGGVTSLNLALQNQTITLQYAASGAIWYVMSSDVPVSAIVTGQSKTVTSAYTLTNADHVILANPTSAAFTVTLPTAVAYFGRFTVTSTGSSANVVTVAASNSQTIDGAASVSVGTQASGADFKSVDLISDGTNWRVV